jgi:phosphoenolpyruvate synthase/pyruvate phosphate dikinase
VTDAHTRPLDSLRTADTPAFGGKSASLGELLAAEIPVPPGFALSTSAFRAFLTAGGLQARIDGATGGMRSDDVGSVQAAADAIREAVCAAAVPDDVRAEIAARYAELGEPPVAVRSSAVGEDSAEATFAGQQETYLWVRGADAVCDAVRDCWASTYSAPAMTYRARLASGAAPLAPEMGVTIQRMVDAAVSGVMFTCNPVSGDPSVIAVNASWGFGLAVVGGEVTPDEYLVSRVTREVVRQTISAKHVEYRPAADGSGTVARPVTEERQREACLDEEQLAALVDVARLVQRHFGGHQDVEWAVDADGAMFVLQSRPVTATGGKAVAGESASALSMVMSRFGAGGGGTG